MKCVNCTAENLSGRALDTSELCEGPVDGEFTRHGELVFSFTSVCRAVVAQNIMEGRYKTNELYLRPAADTQHTVIDLTEKAVTFPQSA